MAAQDTFSRHELRLEGPAFNAEPITPNDTDPLDHISRGIYIGIDGDLDVQMAGGQNVTFRGLFGGTVLPIRIIKVYTTSTAGDLLNLY